MKRRTKPVFYGAEIIASLIYLCAMSAAMMYVLCKDYAFICTVIMTAVSFGIYMAFYVLRKKKGLSLLTFVGILMLVMTVCNIVGSPYISPSFMEFIFMSSSFFDPVFAGAAILMFSLIIGFSTCYFTVYLPRPCFLLLPAFIPFILASRTLGELPLGLLVFLVAGYIPAALGIARPEFPIDNSYVDDEKARKERLIAMGAVGLAAALILIVVPRDTYTPMLRYIDSVFLPRSSGYGNQQLSNFTQYSQPNRGNNNPTADALFMVSTAAPRNVSRWSFDVYDGEKGWTYNETFSGGTENWERRQKRLNTDSLISDLKAGVKDGKLEKYKSAIDGLDDIPSERYNTSAQMLIRVVDGSSTAVVMHPSRTISAQLTGYSAPTYRNSKDEIFTLNAFGRNASYLLEYYIDEPNTRFLEMLETVDFRQLLNDAAAEGVISEEVRGEFADELDSAAMYYSAGLDGTVTDEIQALADSITEGLTSDYEKALAIEQWFGSAGFYYDLAFVPDRAEADYFMFESKRGICTDFATASTLLLRAAGIPARYTEGFALSDESKDAYGRYIVTAAQAHAYSTAFIKGYGWLEIDGTKYAPISDGTETFSFVVTIICIAAGVLAALCIIFRRQLSEAAFAVSYYMKNGNDKIRAVYLRTRKLACHISEIDPKSTTAEEVCDIISRTLSLEKEAREITGAANALLYGNEPPETDEKRLYGDYKAIYKMKRSKKL